MEYTLVYKQDKLTIKETFDFSTNPVFFQKFDVDIDDIEPIEDSMMMENVASIHIKKILKNSDILFFSIIDEKRHLYHDFNDFFNNIY
jgi:hypothetical protein